MIRRDGEGVRGDARAEVNAGVRPMGLTPDSARGSEVVS
jgi:hypothetical protein